MGFKMGKESRGVKSSDNVKIVRRKLDGIYGEAHDNGEVHIESNDIMMHLDEKFPKNKLFPDSMFDEMLGIDGSVDNLFG